MPTYDDMLRRQRVLADFGDFALRSDDLQQVLTEACRLIAEALDADYGKVVEIQRNQGIGTIRAAVGWPENVVDQVTIPLGERSSEAYAIMTSEPLITQDIDDEERFDFPDFMRRAGVVSIVNVPILLPGGEPYGLLQVDHTQAREFSAQDINFLRTYSSILGPVIDRLDKTHQLEVALRRQEELLAELQHRIKNNIATIASLVRLRMRSVSTEDARQELRLIGDRIEALRLVHDQLHGSGQSQTIAVVPYLQDLLANLLRMHDATSRSVTCEVHGEGGRMSADMAVPLGLVINEFATNSLKHAFGESGGTICIEVRPMAEGRFCVTLTDNGRGLPETPSESSDSGSGLRLIDGLARQIGAEPAWSSSPSGGTRLTLEVTT